jgi:hypothetical protein
LNVGNIHHPLLSSRYSFGLTPLGHHTINAGDLPTGMAKDNKKSPEPT